MAKEKAYVVADKGYLYKNGKVFKAGESISLTVEEFANVKELVLEAQGEEAKDLVANEKAEAEAKAEAKETTKK